MIRRFFQLFLLEWRLLFQDKWLLSTATYLPVLLFAFMAAIFAGGQARDLPIGIVDLDKSQLSRNLVRYYDASPTLQVYSYESATLADAAMRGGDIYGMVLIPNDLESMVQQGITPQVSAYYNSQYVLIGKLISGGLMSAHSTYSTKINVVQQLGAGLTSASQALAAAVPVQTQVRPLFNSNSSYAQFLVTAIVPAIWQIFIIVATVMTLIAQQRTTGLQPWLQQGIGVALFSKLLVYQILFMLMGAGYLLWFHGIKHWPVQGNWTVLLFGQWLTILACQGIASMIYLVMEDPSRGVGFAAAYTAPCFAFLGITFPVTDMPWLAQWWRSLLPVSHYLELQVNQMNYGAPLVTTLPYLQALVSLLIVYFPVFGLSWKIANRSHEVTEAEESRT